MTPLLIAYLIALPLIGYWHLRRVERQLAKHVELCVKARLRLEERLRDPQALLS